MNQNEVSTQTNSDNKSIETQSQSNFNVHIVESNISTSNDMNDLYNPEKSHKPFEGIFSTDDERKNENEEINQIENNNKENNNKEKIEIDFKFLELNDILCKKCGKQFKYDINFKNYKYINAECQCLIIKNKQIKKFFNKDITSRKKTKFLYYCKDCDAHLRPDDVDAKSEYNNDYGEIKKHSTHELINLLDNEDDIKKAKELLDEIKDDNDDENIRLFKNIMINIIYNYYSNPNYHHYVTIKNFLKEVRGSNSIKSEENLKCEIFYKINSIDELKEKFEKQILEKIYKIEINKGLLKDLSIFSGKKLDNLKFLSIIGTQLEDISALTTCSFKNLTNIGFQGNCLNNNCISVFEKLELPKIENIYLSNNTITSPKILAIMKKFENLKLLYIGGNKFDEDEINEIKKKKIEYTFPPKFEEFGIGNCLTSETNDFITNNMIINNIKLLYVSNNGFTNFDSFKDVNFTQLEEFWCTGSKDKGYISDIKEIEKLNKKENIKKIVLMQNQINDIEEFLNIIQYFTNLKLSDSRNNPVGKEKVENVLKTIIEMNEIKVIKI